MVKRGLIGNKASSLLQSIDNKVGGVFEALQKKY
jgi:hypothetical protein